MIPRLPSLILTLLIGCALPSVAFACSVCFTASGKTLSAYYAVTVALTLLPFLIGGGIFLAAKRFK
jgi:hypothetical protein